MLIHIWYPEFTVLYLTLRELFAIGNDLRLINKMNISLKVYELNLYQFFMKLIVKVTRLRSDEGNQLTMKSSVCCKNFSNSK